MLIMTQSSYCVFCDNIGTFDPLMIFNKLTGRSLVNCVPYLHKEIKCKATMYSSFDRLPLQSVSQRDQILLSYSLLS